MNLWYPETGPTHANFIRASKTMPWAGTDSEERFRAHRKDPATRQQLQELGWTEDSITYSYNFQGFRSPEFDDRPCGIALGCSFTEGSGLPEHYTWPYMLGQKLGIHTWNLGVGGCSMDTCSRFLEHYIDVLKPKFVALYAPLNLRFELAGEDGHFFGFNIHRTDNKHREYLQEYFLTPTNSEINFKKNLGYMSWVCANKSVPFVYLDTNTDLKIDRKARDLSHSGTEFMTEQADKFYNLFKGII